LPGIFSRTADGHRFFCLHRSCLEPAQRGTDFLDGIRTKGRFLISHDLEQRLADLEKHVEWLQYREGWLLHLLDSRKDPLAYFVLETALTAQHVQGLADVMESAHRTLESGHPLEALDFQRQLSHFIPAKEKPGDIASFFIQRLLIMFAQTGQWPDVAEHFRHDFNVPPAENTKKLSRS
jgi:hypothetical protein